MKLNKITKRSYVGLVGCLGVMGLLTVAMLCPIHSEGANAEGNEARADVRAFIQPVISVALDSSIDMDIIPKSNGAFNSVTRQLTVSTNNSSGYKILMNAAGGKNAMTATDTTNTKTIEPVTGPVTQATMLANAATQSTWGYALTNADQATSEATTYSAVPTTSTQISETSEENAQDKYNLTFGTAVNTQLPAGEYASSVVISVVANPLTITSLTQLVYMQDMSHDICQNTALDTANYQNPVSKQLIDVRDGKKYWVAKLADGNCWMTQNLALDIKNVSTGLSATTTDIDVDWNTTTSKADPANPPSLANLKPNDQGYFDQAAKNQIYNSANRIAPSVTENAVPARETSPSQVATRSWNLGEYILIDPTDGTLCTAPGGSDKYDSVMAGGSLSECRTVGFIDVKNSEAQTYTTTDGNTVTIPAGDWRPTFQAQQGIYDGKPQIVAANLETKEYDPHYLIGNYYQFNTATAGTGGTIANSNAPGSICPKNWHLPISGTQYNGTSGSFYYLLNKYGLTSNVAGTGQDGNNYNIASPPLSFVRSGLVILGNGALRYFGVNGYGWSLISVAFTSVTSAAAYYLDFHASGVGPSYGPNSRWHGFPIRCLAY